LIDFSLCFLETSDGSETVSLDGYQIPSTLSLAEYGFDIVLSKEVSP
jgi:hypothetical protein